MVLGTCFPQTPSYVGEKQEENFTYNGKRENAYFHVQTASGNVENGGKNMVTCSLFAVRVSHKRDAKFL